jgi:hypothetical protein
MIKIPCPKCRKSRRKNPGELRQHVNVFVECSVGNRSLNKNGIRSKDVKILGAGWDTAVWFCTNNNCGNIVRLGQ